MKKIFLVLILVLLLSPVFAFAEDEEIRRYYQNSADMVSVLGASDTVSTSVIGVNDYVAAFNFPAAAATLEVSSTSTSDAAAGTGALQITIEGLDANSAALTEAVATSGTTGTATVGYFTRVNKAYVSKAGTNNANVGNVYIHTSATKTAGVPVTATAIYAQILPAKNNALGACYSLPADKDALIKGVYITASDSADVIIKSRQYSGPWRTIDVIHNRGGESKREFQYFILVPRNSDIAVDAQSPGNTVKVSTMLQLRLVK